MIFNGKINSIEKSDSSQRHRNASHKVMDKCNILLRSLIYDKNKKFKEKIERVFIPIITVSASEIFGKREILKLFSRNKIK